MKKENLYEPFSVSFETIDIHSEEKHSNTFFELVYVLSGTGTKHINGWEFLYEKGHLFLLTPSDYYSFAIDTTSRFFFLRFNDLYLKNNAFLTENVRSIEAVLKEARDIPGCVLKNEADNALIKRMIDRIQESSRNDIYSKALIRQFVNTIIIITAKNIAQSSPLNTGQDKEDQILDILRYIQKNIYSPEKIVTESISSYFRISNTNLGRYFKRHTEETVKQYITNYKTRLIENQLTYSDRRINEIAGDFGFSDVSHFNKFFKRQKGQTPTEFRKVSRSKSY